MERTYSLYFGWLDPPSLLIGVLGCIPQSRTLVAPPKVQGITVSASPPLYLGHLRLHGFKRESQKMPFFMNV